MKGQHILDSVLITNELMDEAKRDKETLLFKVDFKKLMILYVVGQNGVSREIEVMDSRMCFYNFGVDSS